MNDKYLKVVSLLKNKYVILLMVLAAVVGLIIGKGTTGEITTKTTTEYITEVDTQFVEIEKVVVDSTHKEENIDLKKSNKFLNIKINKQIEQINKLSKNNISASKGKITLSKGDYSVTVEGDDISFESYQIKNFLKEVNESSINKTSYDSLYTLYSKSDSLYRSIKDSIAGSKTKVDYTFSEESVTKNKKHFEMYIKPNIEIDGTLTITPRLGAGAKYDITQYLDVELGASTDIDKNVRAFAGTNLKLKL